MPPLLQSLLSLVLALTEPKVMNAIGVPVTQSVETPKVLSVVGSNHLSLQFTDPSHGLYRKAEIIRTTGKPVTVRLQPDAHPSATLVDGLSADGDNHLFAAKLRRELPWSLRVWSLDGRYVALVTYQLINGEIDMRNGRFLQAYDTSTGEMTEFDSKTQLLGADAFAGWSSSKPDVARLRGTGSSVEDAHPKP